MRRAPPSVTVPSLIVAALLALSGCGKSIGDDCGSDIECGTGRLCDRSSKGGYCTVSPCKPDSCPDDSACVEFDDGTTWCMAVCSSKDDCRGGYFCDEETAAVGYCRQNP